MISFKHLYLVLISIIAPNVISKEVVITSQDLKEFFGIETTITTIDNTPLTDKIGVVFFYVNNEKGIDRPVGGWNAYFSESKTGPVSIISLFQNRTIYTKVSRDESVHQFRFEHLIPEANEIQDYRSVSQCIIDEKGRYLLFVKFKDGVWKDRNPKLLEGYLALEIVTKNDDANQASLTTPDAPRPTS